MSDDIDINASVEKSVAPVRRLRVTILEMMVLVAAFAVSFRWPALTLPVGLLLLYAFAQRRDVLRRQARVALGQIALALYLPPAVGLLWIPRKEWGYYLEGFSMMPTFIPVGFIVFNFPWYFRLNSLLFAIAIVVLSTITSLAVILGLGVLERRSAKWWIACLSIAAVMIALTMVWCFVPPQDPVKMLGLSTIPTLFVIGGLGALARRGGAWRIACVIFAAAMSAASTFFTWVLLHIG